MDENPNPFRRRRGGGPGLPVSADDFINYSWQDSEAFIRRAADAWAFERALVERDDPQSLVIDPADVHKHKRLIKDGRERLRDLQSMVGSAQVAARGADFVADYDGLIKKVSEWLECVHIVRLTLLRPMPLTRKRALACCLPPPAGTSLSCRTFSQARGMSPACRAPRARRGAPPSVPKCSTCSRLRGRRLCA
jgi:hypothetical protein